jgi:hypothetical protein
MVAVPGATATTEPPVTVATATSLELQVVVRPVRVFPAASRREAVICCVCPTTRLAVAGERVIEATGTGVTVRVAEPARPSIVATMSVDPGANAAIAPDPSTIATLWLLLDHETDRFDSALPDASREVAVAVDLAPTWRIELASDTETEAVVATGGAEGAGAKPLSPPHAVETSTAVSRIDRFKRSILSPRTRYSNAPA